MSACRNCAKDLPEGGRFCPDCGAAQEPSSATATRAAAPRDHGSGPRFAHSSGPGESRFIPGAVLAGRYRILSLLGKGGMGEVYRADDLKLGQPVALKFLPESIGGDASKLDRFFNEVRVARQVSHPNVCRVYDIGEVGGQHFLSMEYIDGEDLASLLRRIGRLPGDKAVEIGRQLCAGLAAAHDKGVLHRDLKPANVMIDGRGRARITDFGLAGLAEEMVGTEIRSGTPAYMAPEQLAGKEVSVRSDVYALGLVLYEVFTGKPTFHAPSLDALMKLHQTSDVTSPSTLTPDLDPAVERVILRCLERDPASRPPSALAVAAALPGGDPLAAALAAGETPSPEMVAAAGEEGALRPVAAGLLYGGFVALLAVSALLAPRTTLLGLAPVEKPPDVLVEKAREALASAGYPGEPADTGYGYTINSDVGHWIERNDSSPRQWEKLSDPWMNPVLFWYRQSPRRLSPAGYSRQVSIDEPPETTSGMATVVLDGRGRLLELHVEPAQVEDDAGPPPADPNWAALFAAAGLDPQAFDPASSEWTPPVYADRRTAWKGKLPGSGGLEARLEAASYAGKPVYFKVVAPWSRPERDVEPEQRTGVRVGQVIVVVLIVTLLTGSILMARRNALAGSGDRRGALRVAVYTLIVDELARFLDVHHVPDFGVEWASFNVTIGLTLFVAGLVWLLYMALEPLVRRRWPEGIVAWTRLLAGRFRNPLVGRDVLVGCFAGSMLVLLGRLRQLAPVLFGVPPPRPLIGALDALMGARGLIATVMSEHVEAIVSSFILMFFFFLSRMRGSRWYTIVLFAAIFTLMVSLGGTGNVPLRIAFGAAGAVIVTWLFHRFGLLAAMSGLFVSNLGIPLSFDFSQWYTGSMLLPWLLVAALAAYACYVSLGARQAAPAGVARAA